MNEIHLKNGKSLFVSDTIALQIDINMNGRKEKNWLRIFDKPSKKLIFAIDLKEVIAINRHA